MKNRIFLKYIIRCTFTAVTHNIKEITIAVVNKQAPTFPLNPNSGAPLTKDAINENTSAAPLPKLRKVTPARFGDMLNFTTKVSRDKQKYSSAVLPNKRNIIKTVSNKMMKLSGFTLFIPLQ